VVFFSLVEKIYPDIEYLEIKDDKESTFFQMRIAMPLRKIETNNKVEFTTYAFGTQVELYLCTVTLIQIREDGRLLFNYILLK
jgi:hypothetical protein